MVRKCVGFCPLHKKDSFGKELPAHLRRKSISFQTGLLSPQRAPILSSSTPQRTRCSLPPSSSSFLTSLFSIVLKIIGCDFIISAIGVRPCTSFLASQDDDQPNNSSKRTSPVTAPAVPKEYPIHLEPSTGAIIINECFETSCRDAYAAGDCCTVLLSDQGDEAGSGLQSNCSGSAKYHRHWFQMRLWSQARSMGIGAAHSIFNSLETYSTEQENSAEALSETLEEFQQRADDIWGGVMFNIFAHVTHFFDYKVNHFLSPLLWLTLSLLPVR
jgi:hypothetical protein